MHSVDFTATCHLLIRRDTRSRCAYGLSNNRASSSRAKTGSDRFVPDRLTRKPSSGTVAWPITTADIPAAFESLKKAVSLDPEYAEAQAALAGMWTYLYWYVDTPAQEAYRQAIEAAERALALDDSLATAHLALARAKNSGTWDWEGAERAYQQAIALNPSFADAHRAYAHHFLVSAMRRDEDALAEITRALELDPLWSVNWLSAGWVRHHRKEPDQAIANFQRSKDMAPDEPWNYIGIGQNLIFKGQHDAGIAEIQGGIAIAPNNHYLLGFLAWAYGVTNRLDEAKKVVEKMNAASETKEIAPMAFAWAYTGMGDIDNAVAALEEAYQIHDYGAIFIRVPEFYEVLSPDPRYHAILKKMGLES